MADRFMKVAVAFPAKFFDPARRAHLQFRMIFIFPGSGNVLESADLLKPAKFFFSRLRQKLAASALADQSVDLADQRFRNDDVGSPSADFSHT